MTVAGRAPDRLGPARWWVLALYLVVVLVATMVPGRQPARPDHHRHFMTDQHGAPGRVLTRDVLLNVAGFVPIGFFGWQVLGAARFGVALVVAVAALFSVGIETAQHLMPWRFSSWLDVLSNTTGATAGAVIAARVRRRSV